MKTKRSSCRAARLNAAHLGAICTGQRYIAGSTPEEKFDPWRRFCNRIIPAAEAESTVWVKPQVSLVLIVLYWWIGL